MACRSSMGYTPYPTSEKHTISAFVDQTQIKTIVVTVDVAAILIAAL